MIKKNALSERLNHLINEANSQDPSLKTVIEALAGKGQAALLILFSLPFCQPIQIPGFSTPFGVMLAFIGLRIAFGKHMWLPQFLQNKKIPLRIIKKISAIAIKVTDKMQWIFSTRLVWMLNNSLHIVHGLTITLLAVFLSLPLPIPFTNLFSAFPILAFGLGILYDDGLLIIIAYVLSLICFAFFFALIFFGAQGIQHLLHAA